MTSQDCKQFFSKIDFSSFSKIYIAKHSKISTPNKDDFAGLLEDESLGTGANIEFLEGGFSLEGNSYYVYYPYASVKYLEYGKGKYLIIVLNN